jgi:hypothetical protein
MGQGAGVEAGVPGLVDITVQLAGHTPKIFEVNVPGPGRR